MRQARGKREPLVLSRVHGDPPLATDVRRVPGLRQNMQAEPLTFSPSKPFDLTGVFSGPSVPLPYKYPFVFFPSPSRLDDTPCLSLPCFPLQRALPLHSSTPPLNQAPQSSTILLSSTCQLSLATLRVSGSSTFTGTCSPNVVSGTRKEGELIYGSAFVPVRPSVLTATPLAHSVPHRPIHSWNSGQ